MFNARLRDLIDFYQILDDLAVKLGGMRKLSNCTGRLFWPKRGVYYIFEEGQLRSDTGTGLRVVRVGTHALKLNSNTILWNRLYQHRGQINGNGNHRGSIFRLNVGNSIIQRNSLYFPSWGLGASAHRNIIENERTVERAVSLVIGNMYVLWLGIHDSPGPESKRGYIEKNSISLLSNYNNPPLDLPSKNWLGLFCANNRIQSSGLWNSDYVDKKYDPNFLAIMETLVDQIESEQVS